MPSNTSRLQGHPSSPGPASAARSSWSGQLRIGNQAVPVKAYPAVTTPNSLLCQLHAACGGRIQHRKYCPQHGPVPNEEVAKGFEYTSDEFIELSGDEIADLQPEDDKTINLQRFLKADQLDLSLLSGRSLYLVPAHVAAECVYAAVYEALLNKKTWGVGYVVMSGRRQVVMVRPGDGRLMLHVLHRPAQRRACAFTISPSRNMLPKVVRAVEKLAGSDNGPIRWEEYDDDFDERLATLVNTKIAARANGRARAAQRNGRVKSSPKRGSKTKSAGRAVAGRRSKAA